MRFALCGVALAALSTASLVADSIKANFQATFTVYRNPTSEPSVAYSVPADESFSYFTGAEVADDVNLEGPARVIAGVNFEYYANYALNSGLVFRIYDRTHQGDPGELLYTKAVDVLSGGGNVTISFSYDSANVLPDRFFFSVQFAGTGAGHVAGMMVPGNRPTVGDSDNELLQKQGDRWVPIELTEKPPKARFGRHGHRNHIGLHHKPHSRISVESARNLDEPWSFVAEVETDENGDAEYETPEEDDDQKFYRLVAP